MFGLTVLWPVGATANSNFN